ncbi:alpha/beta hydrolase [Maribacter sp. ANRC-HE7]|uniref:Alpha/beta hydrolase n=1 Tax=Maribacter aquimaris TaxID=2737171 RepID=A0ABR7V3V6_9FLAO|nr:alpha/beta hydrolase [Maribacter aquimaris]MBD0777828.1 alpha/beta hydrolase [Maribacter aquimaris]
MMNRLSIFNIISSFTVLFSSTLCLSQDFEINLWDKVPNAIENLDYKEQFTYLEDGKINGVSKVSQPTITVFLADPKNSNGTGVVICPGGAYSHLALNKEGFLVAKWLNSLGISAFVLKYRLPSDAIMINKSIGPLQDAQQAIRVVRQNSKEWNLDADKIGIMGFSAGGHLAASLSTRYADQLVSPKDNISAKPDFSILIYPVISMKEEITHKNSRKNLLGTEVKQEVLDKYSNEIQVDGNSPKAFIVHASDDRSVPVGNSLAYYSALIRNNVSAEMHIYENGGHGFGMGTMENNNFWTVPCENWLIFNKYISD